MEEWVHRERCSVQLRSMRASTILIQGALLAILSDGCRSAPPPTDDARTAASATDTAASSEPAAPQRIRTIVSGALTTCAIFDDGHVACWGWSMNGHTSDPREQWLGPHPAPLRAPPTAERFALALGGGHACTVIGDKLSCWGLNDFGELGDRTTESRLTPLLVPGMAPAISASLGRYFTCALTADERVFCWGANHQGELGCDGGLICRNVEHRAAGSGGIPREIAGAAGAASIAAGPEYACEITKSGDVLCWGSNRDEQMSDGSNGYFTEPTAVEGVHGVRSLALGEGHACALLDTGEVQCWGRNGPSEGQCGAGEPRRTKVSDDTGKLIFPLHSRPAIVKGLPRALQIVAGIDHTCALVEGAKVDCWGKNDRGQLGDGTNEARFVPTAVNGLGPVREISAGASHTCALVGERTVKCWGWNDTGQIGDGTKTNRALPVDVQGL